MNIAFVGNGWEGCKTELFLRIAEGLKKQIKGLDAFYICGGQRQKDYLMGHNVPESHLLLLNWYRRFEHNSPIGDYKLNELAGYDRSMKYYVKDGLEYLKSVQLPFYNFIKDNNIRYVFGEMTWAYEIILARICQDKFKGQCTYLHPQSIRIPNGRFCFMDTEFQDSLYQPTEYIQPEGVLSEFQLPIKPVVPQRVAVVASDLKETMRLRHRLGRLYRSFKWHRNNTLEDIQGLPLAWYERNKREVMSEFNTFYYTKVLTKAKWDDFKDKKYVFVTLHMQPEASVDVVGRYYDDQLQNIKNIWRILPTDCYLVVKEHTNAIGDRSRGFFKSLQQLTNVVIPDENISSHKILNNSIGVFTISGTVALETALYRKDAFIFGRTFFDKLKYCHRITLEDFKDCANFEDLKAKCIERDKNKMDLEDYSEYIIRSSFPGIIDPPVKSYLYEDPENIATIVSSFKLFLEKCK